MNKYLLKKEIEIEIDYMSCFHSKYPAMMSFRWIACSRCSTLHKHKKFQIMICLMFGLDYIGSQPHPAIWVYWMKCVFVSNVTNDGADGAVSRLVWTDWRNVIMSPSNGRMTSLEPAILGYLNACGLVGIIN